MSEYLKVSNVFGTGSFDNHVRTVCQVGYDDICEMETITKAKMVAQALNVHDKNADRIDHLEGELEQLRKELEEAKGIIEMSVNGVNWWRSEHPESDSGSDDEFLSSAESFLAKLNKD